MKILTLTITFAAMAALCGCQMSAPAISLVKPGPTATHASPADIVEHKMA